MTAPTAVSNTAAELSSPARASRATALARRLPWWIEAAVAVVGYELYDGVQALTAGDFDEARAHGRLLAHAEQHLHVWIEPAVNRFATTHSWIAIGAGYYYELAHVMVTMAVLAFLWVRRAEVYARLRNALLGLSLVALVGFWQWPVAPPRLAVGGVHDTLVRNNILGAAHVHGGFVNLYAAMPSLHVAWACWCAGAMVLTTSGWRRHLAWLYPLATTAAVVATANHYLLDAVAGAALAGVALGVTRRAGVRLRVIRVPAQTRDA
jgi:hypothetical protein